MGDERGECERCGEQGCERGREALPRERSFTELVSNKALCARLCVCVRALESLSCTAQRRARIQTPS